MKLGLLFAVAGLVGCTHLAKVATQPKAPPAFIVSTDFCRESQTQPDDGKLVLLVCFSSDGSDVAGVLYDRSDWLAKVATGVAQSTVR